jgi:hypothetical protein
MGNVGKGVRRVVASADRGLIKPTVSRTYDYNMEYDKDPSIKGDLQCVARGSSAILQKDQLLQRRKEMLQATMNPLDSAIMGAKGRAVMLRETLEIADFDVEKIIPDDMEMQLNMAGAPPVHELAGGQGPNASGAPAGMGGGGGTPEGEETLDAAGQPAQGQQIKQDMGMRDGGMVRRRELDNADDSRERI